MIFGKTRQKIDDIEKMLSNIVVETKDKRSFERVTVSILIVLTVILVALQFAMFLGVGR